MNKGKLIIISGWSGAGKGTICRRLLEKYPDAFVLSISATTRQPREGEVDGREYFFVTTERFEQMIADGELLEHACYVGNYYGTPKPWVEEQLREGKNVILEIEVQGAFQVKQLIPEAVLLFVVAPSMEELRRRLEGRNSETAEQIEDRLKRAEEESVFAEKYDYIIVNDIVEKSVDLVHNIILSEKNTTTGERNMLHPSYTDLMDAVNADASAEQPVVQSRYSIVMAASKRARQLVDGAEPMVEEPSTKPLSTAVDEIYSQQVKIIG